MGTSRGSGCCWASAWLPNWEAFSTRPCVTTRPSSGMASLLGGQRGQMRTIIAAGVGALPPPDGHVGGQHPLLGGPWGVGVGGVFGQGHPDVLWDEPPHPGRPPQRLPSKARPRRETQTPCCAPPKPPQSKKRPPAHKSFESGSSSSSDQALHRPHGKGKGKQAQQKRREEPPSLEGDESPDPLLGEQVFVPYPDGVYPGVVTSVVAGGGDKVWVEHPGEKEMFRVERHLLYVVYCILYRPKRSLTPNRTLTRRLSRPPSQPNLNPSLRLSRPLSPSPKLPLRPPPWRWMPQRTPRPNPQPNHQPKPMPRPRMEVKPRPRPPFGRTQQAPALRCRAA